MSIVINNNYYNPENNEIEIVERKGFGHPDTLADQLAKECSRIYSQYCLDHFGVILHHNFDKLYIGAGCFRYINNELKMISPIKVFVNGRASNTFNGKKIDIEKLLIPVIREYVGSVLPRLNVLDELEIHINPTQNSKFPHWFEPNDINDVPDSKEVFANDTSLCISHYPLTICEDLTLNVSNYFWKYQKKNKYPTPRFNDVGQDIKVMTFRNQKDITITVCLPVYYDMFTNMNEYINVIKKYEKLLYRDILSNSKYENYNISLDINKSITKDYHYYTLGKGSCLECGEEGVVGRGNNLSGLIPTFRPYSMESPFGKNERYHTGRVLSNLANIVTKQIYDELGISSSIYCLTQNKSKLLNPSLLYISIDKKVTKELELRIKEIVSSIFDENSYLNRIMEVNIV